MTLANRDALAAKALVALQKEFVHPDEVTSARVSSRLANSIDALAAGGALQALADRVPGGSATGIVGATGTPWIALSVSFALGGAVGAVAYAASHPPPPPQIVYRERAPRYGSVQKPQPRVEANSAVVVTASAEPTLRPHVTPAASMALARPSATDLAEQTAKLDLARKSFMQGQYDATLERLESHAARYPRSVLTEEREALAIKALAALGRASEARARARSFIDHYPQSFLLSSINDSLLTIP
jgi:hypothetical protein